MPYAGYHVIPQEDVIEHDQAVNCICRPTREVHYGIILLVHHSLDGREHREPNHDRENCVLCAEGIL